MFHLNLLFYLQAFHIFNFRLFPKNQFKNFILTMCVKFNKIFFDKKYIFVQLYIFS